MSSFFLQHPGCCCWGGLDSCRSANKREKLLFFGMFKKPGGCQTAFWGTSSKLGDLVWVLKWACFLRMLEGS